MTRPNVMRRRTFLRSTALALGSLALPQATASAAELTAVPPSRLKRLAAGANICDWFADPGDHSADHFANYISKHEAETMAAMRLTHVRLCVAPRIVMDQRTGDIIEENAAHVFAAIDRLHRAGLLVIVDLQNSDRAAELDPAWQDAFARFWGLFAARLADADPEFTILEIINEPVFNHREDEWNPLNARIAAVIRSKAPQHTIVTAGPNWGGIDGLKKLKVLPDKNIIYSFHFYDPFTFTHQGATWTDARVRPLNGVPYPSSPEAVAPLLPALASAPDSQKMLEAYGKSNWNKEKLAQRFQEAIDWGAANHVPIYCGEFGVFADHSKPEHRANWFHDLTSVLAQNDIGWAIWGWDSSFGLNRKLNNGKIEVDKMVAEALNLKI